MDKCSSHETPTQYFSLIRFSQAPVQVRKSRQEYAEVLQITSLLPNPANFRWKLFVTPKSPLDAELSHPFAREWYAQALILLVPVRWCIQQMRFELPPLISRQIPALLVQNTFSYLCRLFLYWEYFGPSSKSVKPLVSFRWWKWTKNSSEPCTMSNCSSCISLKNFCRSHLRVFRS